MNGKRNEAWALQKDILDRLVDLNAMLKMIERNTEQIAYFKGELAKRDFTERAIV